MAYRHTLPGIHRLGHAHVNLYLVVDDDGVTVVDTGLPATWPLLLRALRKVGAEPEQVRAVVLTHAHFDHLGLAARLRGQWRLPVWAHPEEFFVAAHPSQYQHENSRLWYPLRHPGGIPILTGMVAAGALTVDGVTDLSPLTPGEVLDVPGRPRIVFTPGHTFGHCALHLPEHDAVITGDALVTLDPYTGVEGPQIVSGAATADSARALESLEALAATRAAVVFPGHGRPWRDGVLSAVEQAAAAGPS
ncbi:MBL fold metallo-hydrolase [Thermobifida halotolerans]|uniref:MBL fold metallo-hydrolase n=1 Tax=Thermobifida halotolerans TaxID=483545 RepID=A0A399G725_9ACTN|nr:MBL fold metallo-hydrolase [Thermobifida halotolerans]UOE17669.1 MBL fold metallo-hydrolase [Thermobifida halotolerans]